MNISFQHPWVLLILPVIIAALIVSMKFMYSRNMAQKVSRIFVRFIVAALLVLALSGITFKIVGKDVTTIFLVDVSDSVKERKDEVTTYISDAIKTKGRHDYVGVIAFGGDSRVEQFISKDVTFSGLMTEVNTQATNLEDAVNMASGFLEGTLHEATAAVLTGPDIMEMRSVVEKVTVNDKLIDHAVMIVEATRSDADISCGASPRALLALLRCAQSYATLFGRDYCIPEDIINAATLTLPHRLVLTAQARMNRTSQEQVIRRITDHVKVPS